MSFITSPLSTASILKGREPVPRGRDGDGDWEAECRDEVCFVFPEHLKRDRLFQDSKSIFDKK